MECIIISLGVIMARHVTALAHRSVRVGLPDRHRQTVQRGTELITASRRVFVRLVGFLTGVQMRCDGLG